MECCEKNEGDTDGLGADWIKTKTGVRGVQKDPRDDASYIEESGVKCYDAEEVSS
jgi:hypothetical protein